LDKVTKGVCHGDVSRGTPPVAHCARGWLTENNGENIMIQMIGEQYDGNVILSKNTA